MSKLCCAQGFSLKQGSDNCCVLGTRSWHGTQSLLSVVISVSAALTLPAPRSSLLGFKFLSCQTLPVFIRQKCMVFYINEWQLTNIQWCSKLPQNPAEVSQPGCFQPCTHGCGLGEWEAWAGCCSARRGRAMCTTLKRNPGKEDRKASFSSLEVQHRN